jgi:hypothetical protein
MQGIELANPSRRKSSRSMDCRMRNRASWSSLRDAPE